MLISKEIEPSLNPKRGEFATLHLVGQHPLEQGVLPFDLLGLLGLINLEHPQLSPPPVEALLADLPLSAYILYRFISALRFPLDAYFSFCCVSFAFNYSTLSIETPTKSSYGPV